MNTIILAMYHYRMDDDFEKALDGMNLALTIIFGVELAIKLFGMGVINYFRDLMNYLDFFVVVFSILELIFLSGNSGLSALRAIRIFRTFRVLRVARLFRYMQSMTTIITVVSKSLSKFVYLALLLLLFILIFALIGM